MNINAIRQLAIDFEAKVIKLADAANKHTLDKIAKLQVEAAEKYNEARELYKKLL